LPATLVAARGARVTSLAGPFRGRELNSILQSDRLQPAHLRRCSFRSRVDFFSSRSLRAFRRTRPRLGQAIIRRWRIARKAAIVCFPAAQGLDGGPSNWCLGRPRQGVVLSRSCIWLHCFPSHLVALLTSSTRAVVARSLDFSTAAQLEWAGAASVKTVLFAGTSISTEARSRLA